MNVRSVTLKVVVGEKSEYIRKNNYYVNYELGVRYHQDTKKVIKYYIYSKSPDKNLADDYYEEFGTCNRMLIQLNQRFLLASDVSKVSVIDMLKIMDKKKIKYSKKELIGIK